MEQALSSASKEGAIIMSGWYVSGMSTEVGVICELGTSSNANWGFSSKQLVLRGYTIQSPSSLAASTVMATLRRGQSSGVALSSTPICLDTPEFALSANGINIKAPYFAIAAGTTHVAGLFASMWGDYE